MHLESSLVKRLSAKRNVSVYFFFVAALTYSGQTGASLDMMDVLSKQGWDCRAIKFPWLDRTKRLNVLAHVRFIFSWSWACLKTMNLFWRRKVILHINIGQNLSSFARMGLPYICLKAVRRNLPSIMSLHGSVFQGWDVGKLEARILKYMIQISSGVTVLGKRQKEHLESWGIHSDHIMIVNGTTEVGVLSPPEIRAKHEYAAEIEPFRLLHLSLLIPSKGYRLYLDVLELLASRNGAAIEAVLCGQVTISSSELPGMDVARERAYILERIATINALGRVKSSWIEGATVSAKWKLYQRSHVFVFPSRFPVEAQPRVLLEAMAMGCVVICSMVGEIPSMLDKSSAILMEKPSAEGIAEAVEALMAQRQRRIELALSARQEYLERFSAERFTKTWDSIFSRLATLSAQPPGRS